MRMYLRYAERKGYGSKILDQSKGTEAGIKSVDIELSGEYAFGNLKAEAGVHRMVRLSPFNADHLRQTSFALVEVSPLVEQNMSIQIDPSEIKIDTYRSSGAGGQSVNTTDSAVRVTHIPTKIVVTCQNERSQLQNKEKALAILRSKLMKLEEERSLDKLKEAKGEHKSAEWGNQIRSYVLHPYKMVKDHRTEIQTSDVEKVLDGDLDYFVEGWLRQQ
jgi:peptide chain release factor 2